DKSKVDYWNPVDFYVGGDHAVAHLLYVRFWCKFFADEGLLSFREPVKRLLYNGYINAPDGKKMSKSLGNVIDPLDIVDQGYGADALRTYEMFIGPYEMDAAWDPRGIGGVYRFLNRVWTMTQEYLESGFSPNTSSESTGRSKRSSQRSIPMLDKSSGDPASLEAPLLASSQNNDSSKVLAENPSEASLSILKAQHSATKRVTEDLHRNSFNTAVAALMEYVNELYKLKVDGFSSEWQEALEALVKLLAPFAPHIACELFEQLGYSGAIEKAGWPQWDDKYLVAEEAEVVVQVNGKLRAKFMVPADRLDDEDDIKQQALSQENVQSFVSGKKIVKTIYIKKNHLLNIVVK
ncbi:MAG: class I tRNA ligase family protein, partial [Candidatus Nomurabacteria bacterium]|nr:class I tRNA ligase family protein [Candidatus Nomurabacteria bacterium]